MFGSTVLEIAIGLVFVYLVLSLVVTAASEMVASWFKWRATNLFQGIGELLRDPDHGGKWAEKLYKHPLISALSLSPEGQPSYIPSRTFALALLDLVVPAGTGAPRTIAEIKAALAPPQGSSGAGAAIPEELRKILSILLDEAGHDLEKFKATVEVWFNNSMDRVSGWYKRKAQTAGLIIAAVVTLAFNADTLSIVSALSNETLRASILAQAEAAAKLPAPAGASNSDKDQATVNKATEERQKQFRASIEDVQKLGLPIGWKDFVWADIVRNPGDGSWIEGDTLGLWVTRILGWFLTICAVSLGAPFWFDLLNRIMNIRAAGKAPEEQPKTPKEVPQPAAPGNMQTPSGAGAVG